MIKFLHTGDIHLGLQFKNLKLNSENSINRRLELWDTFTRMIDYAIVEKLDFIFLVGDIFEDKYFTLGDIKRLRDILAKAVNINILITAGNHDYLHQNSLYNGIEWSENVYIFGSERIEKIEFTDKNTAIFGYSWDRNLIDNDNILDNIDFNSEMENKILLLHGDVYGNSRYLPLDIKRLKSFNLDYIALGHIHKPELFTDSIAYCGSPEPFDFGEIGDRGFIEGSIENNHTIINLKPFSKRRFIIEKLDLNENMSYMDIINNIIELNLNRKIDYIRLFLEGYIDININMEELSEDIRKQFYYIEIIDNTIPDYDLEELERSFENNIVGSFIKTMKESDLNNEINKKALYYGLDVLLKEHVK